MVPMKSRQDSINLKSLLGVSRENGDNSDRAYMNYIPLFSKVG